MLTAWGGGAMVLLIAWLMGNSLRLERRDIWPAIVAGLLNITGWLYFTALGLTMLPAGRATVLAYTMPLWAFLAAILLTGERVTARRTVALGFGVGAVLILGGDDLIRLGAAPLGVIATLAAAASWGLGTVVQKKTLWRTPLLTVAGWQLLIGGAPLAALAITQDTAPFANFTIQGAMAMAYTVLIATVLGYLGLVSRTATDSRRHGRAGHSAIANDRRDFQYADSRRTARLAGILRCRPADRGAGHNAVPQKGRLDLQAGFDKAQVMIEGRRRGVGKFRLVVPAPQSNALGRKWLFDEGVDFRPG